MTPPPNEVPPKARDGAIALSVGALALAAVLLGQPAPPSPAPAATAGDPAEDAACAEWSNGCRVCIRRADGPACSLPGIACTPGASACTRQEP